MRLSAPLRMRVTQQMHARVAAAGPNTSAAIRAYVLLGMAAAGEDLAPFRAELAALLAEELSQTILAALERTRSATELAISKLALEQCPTPVSQNTHSVPTPPALPQLPPPALTVQETTGGWDDLYEV